MIEIETPQNIPVEEIREKIVVQLIAENDKLPRNDAEKIAADMTAWLTCPRAGKKRVEPMVCMFCPYGHMTECHYPLDCQDANCSHYQRQNEE